MSKEQLFPSQNFQNWGSIQIKPLHFYSTQKWLTKKQVSVQKEGSSSHIILRLSSKLPKH